MYAPLSNIYMRALSRARLRIRFRFISRVLDTANRRLWERRRAPLRQTAERAAPECVALRWRDPMRLPEPAVDRVLRLWVLPNLSRNVLVAHADGSVRLWDARAASRPLREFGVLSKSLSKRPSAALLRATHESDIAAGTDELQHVPDSSESETAPLRSASVSSRPQVASTSASGAAVLSVARHPLANLLAFGAADSDEEPVQIVRETRDEPAARRLHSLRHHIGFAARRIAPALSLSFHPILCRLAVASSDSVVSVFSLSSGND